MMKRKRILILGAMASSAIAAAVACSETGPDADPRQNGCIAANCFDGSVPPDGAPLPGMDGGLPPVPDGGYPDPLVGTTKSATLIKGGFQFTEGPVWISNKLLFSDVQTNRIHELLPDGGTRRLRDGNSGGANGNAVDNMGRLVTCEGANRGLSRSTDPQLANRGPLATTFNGSGFNQPNDVIVRSDGNVYFTDPCYGCDPDGGQDKEGVYRLPPGAAVDGALRLADFNKPNGIALSPDGNTLYVVENGANRLLSAPVKADGTLDGAFAKVADTDGGDGMAVDLNGNLYVAADAGVLVFDKTGKSLGIVTVPQGKPANCTFGGSDMRTLYITSNNGAGNAATGLYSIKLNVPGLP
jgi:gluconolactonase